ncbi:MAG: tRNA(fMet)-specific endonuclease VapC [Pseudomonadota bacterium]|nr:tRNA(fMet)-specific endonuclease VapC [Pseudomonadota bacterium]
MIGPRYLFDTNLLSALIKRPVRPLAERIAALDRQAFCTSIIVACELRYGVLKKDSPRLTEKVDHLLTQVTVLPLDAQVEQHYAEIRVALEKVGQPIGHNDLLIAAHARALVVCHASF